jgi:purine-nucleoside phosphorylase
MVSTQQSDLRRRLEASGRALADKLGRASLPDSAVILGSGFKGFESRLADARTADLADVVHMPVPRVEGHGAAAVVGRLGDRDVLVVTGRVHLYEGHSAHDVVFPLRVLASLGVKRVLLTNAAGSVDPSLRPGQVDALKDQMNLTGVSCLAGPDGGVLGPIFIDMGAAFDPEWRRASVSHGDAVEGVYAGLQGPAYETPAETAMLHKLGANVVGMSTVQEVLAARQLGLRVAGLSFVTNMAGGLGHGLSHAEVLELGAKHRPMLHDLLAKAVGARP